MVKKTNPKINFPQETYVTIAKSDPRPKSITNETRKLDVKSIFIPKKYHFFHFIS